MVCRRRGDLPSITAELPSTFSFHPEGPGVAVGFSDRNETAGFKFDYGPDEFLPWIAGHAVALAGQCPNRGSPGVGHLRIFAGRERELGLRAWRGLDLRTE